MLLYIHQLGDDAVCGGLVQRLAVAGLQCQYLQPCRLCGGDACGRILHRNGLICRQSQCLQRLEIDVRCRLMGGAVLAAESKIHHCFQTALREHLHDIRRCAGGRHRHLQPPAAQRIHQRLCLRVGKLAVGGGASLAVLPVSHQHLLTAHRVVGDNGFPDGFFVGADEVALRNGDTVFQQKVFTAVLVVIFRICQHPIHIKNHCFNHSSFPSSSKKGRGKPLPQAWVY